MASVHMGLGMRESGYEHLRSFFDSTEAKKMRFAYLKYIDLDRNFDIVKEEEEFLRITKNNF
jgi:hypothetical protein